MVNVVVMAHILFVIHLTTLPVAQTVWCWVVGWLVNDELERLWKDVVMAYIKVLSWCLLGGTEGNHENPVRVISVLAGIKTRHPPNIIIISVNGINHLTTMLWIILRQVYDVVTCFYSYIATCLNIIHNIVVRRLFPIYFNIYMHNRMHSIKKRH
jgi:hypothetical protein